MLIFDPFARFGRMHCRRREPQRGGHGHTRLRSHLRGRSAPHLLGVGLHGRHTRALRGRGRLVDRVQAPQEQDPAEPALSGIMNCSQTLH